MIATTKEEQKDKEECHFLCTSVATRKIVITDDYGEYLADMKVCEKCHNMLDASAKKFKWELI